MYVLLLFVTCLSGCGGLAADLAPSNAPDVVVNASPIDATDSWAWYIWTGIGFVAGYIFGKVR